MRQCAPGGVRLRVPNRERDIVGRAEALTLTESVKRTIEVLIVDDDDTLRESCASVLGAEGFSVTVSGRGAEATALVKRRRFDIVLLDLHMAQVSGMDLLRWCLDAFPETLAIIMTGDPSVESSLEALRAGAWDYLPKPFSASHLQILIGRAAHTVVVARESQGAGGGAGNEARRVQRRVAAGRVGGVPEGGRAGAAGGGHGRVGVHLGRERHGQGADRAVHPWQQPAQQPAARGGELRGAAGGAAGERDVRPRPGRVHRRAE
jgi:CheY-like chemotaxis protein